MKINLLNQLAKTKSVDNNAANLVNWYLEEDKNNGKYPIIAIPTPGATVWNSGSGSVVRKLFRFNDVLYGVVDNTFYEYNSLGVRTSRGTLNTSTGGLDICAIDGQIMIVDGIDGYTYTIATTTFATIVDADFPANPISCAAQDGIFLVAEEDSSTIYGSDVGDGTSWNALSFADAEGSGDYVTKLLSHRREMWVMGSQSMELWINSGAPTFSFEPNQSIYIHTGIAAIDSAAIGNNNIYLLGQQLSGGVAVYQMLSDQGYIPQKISDRSIDNIINGFTTIDDAIGYCYCQSGHEFYVLIFPTEAKTFVFDITTGIWHERQSTVNNVQTRHLSNAYAYCYGLHIFGDFQSGKLYYFDEDAYTDNGTSIYRELISAPGYMGGKKIFLDRLQIDTETDIGSSKTYSVSLSKDSGHSYTALSNGTAPSAGGRMFWSRLGMTQNAFVIKVSTTMNGKCILLGAEAEVRQGIN